MLNRFEGIGNLGKDPELRYSTGENQVAICRFTIAVDKGYGQNKKTVWMPVVTFGKLAENCNKFLAKGRKVYVAGEIDIREYEGQDGQKRFFTEVAANTVEFLSSNESSGAGQQWGNQAQPAWSQPQNQQPQQNQYVTRQQWQQEQQQNMFQQQTNQQGQPTDMPPGFEQVAANENVPF